MNMKRQVFNRIMGVWALLCMLCVGVGYLIAPRPPVIFAHLPKGAYVAEFHSQAECNAAMDAHLGARGINTNAEMTIEADGALDMCSSWLGRINLGGNAGTAAASSLSGVAASR